MKDGCHASRLREHVNAEKNLWMFSRRCWVVQGGKAGVDAVGRNMLTQA